MDSFDTVQKQYENMIHKIIYSLNIYRNKEEFYQTGLIALWEAYEKFDTEKGAFPAFAFSYIKGRIMTEMTTYHRHADRNVYQKEEFWEQIQDDCKEDYFPKEQILSYCTNLTENQKKWVIYTFLHMLTIQEIATLENVSTSAVKKWRYGAKAKILDNSL
ncbi:sigma-70 family RNA polymerase sigma factor [Rossellomorea oryzaecorticis]|uniref:Sigma-70 family RNA polymerase sigma factor n=1 Tax=Rossellomorea oryzaecorticis TaxID=1396505 RepID=A0ABW8VUI7_9BACI